MPPACANAYGTIGAIMVLMLRSTAPSALLLARS
jgi:hypothetical protein